MLLCKWEDLPDCLRLQEVYPYYEKLRKKKFSLVCKRIFDIVASLIMLIILSPVFLILAIAIKLDSPGPVFFRQVRVTQYGKEFRIFKFRSMVNNADRIGSQVTTRNDSRVTRVGRFVRKYRLDEICQLIDIFRGTMSFVGTRPEVPKYVKQYTPEMMATLLLPAGVTSEASIKYKDEDRLLESATDADSVYVNAILPEKMKYNLEGLSSYSFFRDISVMIRTLGAVILK